MNKSTSAHLALLGANLLYGAGFTVAKIVMPSLIQPRAFVMMRVSVACILFWIVLTLFKKKGLGFSSLSRADKRRVILGGVFGVALNQIFFLEGLSLTEPFHAALIMLTTPILVMVFSSLFLGQRFGVYKVAGLVFGVSGALILVTGKTAPSHYAPDIVLGDLLVFLNAIFYSIYLVIIKPVMDKRESLQVITWVFSIGALIVVPLGFGQFLKIDFGAFDRTAWMAMAFIIIGVTFFTYLWNAYGIKNLTPVITGAYIYTQPVFAAILSVLYYQERITLTKLLAALLISGGVWLVNRKPPALRSEKMGES